MVYSSELQIITRHEQQFVSYPRIYALILEVFLSIFDANVVK